MIAVKSNENERKFVKAYDDRNRQKPSVYAGSRHFAQARESLKGYFEPCYPHHNETSFACRGKRGFLWHIGIIWAKQANWGFRTASQLLRSPIWFSAVKNHPMFRCALLDFDFTCNIKRLQTRRPRGMMII